MEQYRLAALIMIDKLAAARSLQDQKHRCSPLARQPSKDGRKTQGNERDMQDYCRLETGVI